MVNTDKEMKEINAMIGALTEKGSGDNLIQVHDLLSGEVSEIRASSPELNEKITNSISNKGIIHCKKRCTNPDQCLHGEGYWHSVLVIADGDVFLSWETTKTIRNVAIEQVMNNLLGGLFGG